MAFKGTATSATDTNGGNTSTVTVPSGASEGDVFILTAISYQSSSSASASGFEQLDTANVNVGGTLVRTTILARARTGTEGASFTVTQTGSQYTYLMCHLHDGRDLTGSNLENLLDVAAASATNASFATPAVTATQSDVDVVTVFAGVNASVSAAPSGWTQRANLDGGFGAVATKTQNAGTTGTNTWTGSGSDSRVRITVALAPAPIVEPEEGYEITLGDGTVGQLTIINGSGNRVIPNSVTVVQP